MTDLTAGVERIGPHPATRTEAEARADGHYSGKVELLGYCLCRETGLPILEARGTGLLAKADIAQAYLAWSSYDAMKAALEGVIRVADRQTVEFDAARAALRIARGEKP